MKYNLLYTVFLIFAISPNVLSQNIRTLFKNEIVYGKVQMITGSETITSLTNGTTTIPVKDTTYFDEKGNTTARHIRIVDLYIYKYLTRFDSAGNKLETTCDTGCKKLTIRYDKRGNMVQVWQISKTGKPYCSTRLKYDDHHNLIEYAEYYDSGKMLAKKIYLYSEKGFAYEEDNYFADGSLVETMLYRYGNYDEKGNWTHLDIAEKSPQGKPESIRVTNRQITYYQ